MCVVSEDTVDMAETSVRLELSIHFIVNLLSALPPV